MRLTFRWPKTKTWTLSSSDVIIGDTEATDELIDKHASIMRIMENKKKTVEEFIVKGEKLMEDPKSPKFLETHVSKLKDAWEVAQQKAQERKDALNNNLEAWKIFENKKVETAKSQDGADKLLKSIKRVYDLEKGPADLAEKLKLAAAMRSKLSSSITVTLTIWSQVGDRGLLQPDQQRQQHPADLPAAGDEGRDARPGEEHPLGSGCLQPLLLQVKVLKDRLPVLDEIDKALGEIFKFNQVNKRSVTAVTFLLPPPGPGPVRHHPDDHPGVGRRQGRGEAGGHQVTAPGSWLLAPGSWLLAPGSWLLAPGPWLLA